MTREEFVKQRCEIDKITEEEFEKTYRVVDCNCGAYYCKGYRCLDLDGLLKENQKYKEVIDKAIEYINHFSKESEVKIYGLPKCKVFIGDIEELLEILKEVE